VNRREALLSSLKNKEKITKGTGIAKERDDILVIGEKTSLGQLQEGLHGRQVRKEGF